MAGQGAGSVWGSRAAPQDCERAVSQVCLNQVSGEGGVRVYDLRVGGSHRGGERRAMSAGDAEFRGHGNMLSSVCFRETEVQGSSQREVRGN